MSSVLCTDCNGCAVFPCVWSLARWLDSGLDSLAVQYAADEGDRDQVTKALMDEPVKGSFGDATPDQGEFKRPSFSS